VPRPLQPARPSAEPGSLRGRAPGAPHPFIQQWLGRDEEVARQREELAGELTAAMREGRAHQLLPITGEVAGMVKEILPAGEIVRRMVADAESAIRYMTGMTS
jgi:enoyl-[acyl-carrier protein] reductase II